jgi:hypothetical protein
MLGPDGTLLAGWGHLEEHRPATLGEFPGGSSLTIDRQGNVYASTAREIWRLACVSPS